MLKALSVIGYIGMAGGMVALIVTRRALSPSPWVILPQVTALGLMTWARVTFGRRSFHFAANPTSGGLVTTGPYRLIRHPIYAAVCLFTAPAAIAYWSWTTVMLGALVLAGTLVRVFAEEHLVVRQYPEYRHYATTTWRMIPGVF